MTEDKKKKSEKKGFFARIVERLDNKMKEKAKKAPCCGTDDKDKGSCC